MTEELRLWAIGVDQVRQCFAAPEELAGRLRQITDSLVPRTRRRVGGLLSKLGPLTRQPVDGGVIRADLPNHADAESMMIGRFVPSDRLVACWKLVRAWLDDLAVAKTTIELPQAKIDELEFDLVRARVPTRVSIRHLWGQSLDIPLQRSDDMSVGYMEAASVDHLIEQWTAALPELETDTVAFAAPLIEFLTQIPKEQPGSNADSPDLVAWWTAR